MKNYFVGFMLLFLPASFCRVLFRLMWIKNVKIGHHVKVGFSLILVKNLILEDNSKIGHLNFVKVRSLLIGGGKIRHINLIYGDIDVSFEGHSWMHSRNKISGSSNYKRSVFVVKRNSAIIIGHLFNVTDDIIIGEDTTIAGVGSQFWTHSFSLGEKQNFRVDGPIYIGKKNYIGARCVFCAGVRTVDYCTIGANTTVYKSLDKPGTYVSQHLRFIEKDWEGSLRKLGNPVAKNIYRKHIDNLYEK